MSDAPFKRGDVLEFHHADHAGWTHADGSLLIVTQDQTSLVEFTGRWMLWCGEYRAPLGEHEHFSPSYFSRVTKAEVDND